MKHPHHDIILAYLDGRPIQRLSTMMDKQWIDILPWSASGENTLYSLFSNKHEFRIKPTPKYRVVFKTKNGMLLISAGYYESLSAFVAYGDFQPGWEAIELIQATRKEE